MPNEGVVHVIDDDEASRESLAFVLDSAGLEPRTYASALNFLEVCDSAASGCIVTDVRMPDMNGLELVRALRARNITLPVIVITGHGGTSLAVEAMRAGALDFLEKPFDTDLLLSAVASALDDGSRASREAAECTRFNAMLETLSHPETAVLRGLVAGESNKVIARDMDIAPRMVEVFRADLMTKTAAASLSKLVRIAILAEF